MKALSLTPPWHVAILRHGKRIENRDWRGCSFRGPVLLHASKGVGTQDDFDETVESILDIISPPPGVGPGKRHDIAHEMAEMRIGGRGRPHAEGWWAPSPMLTRGAIVGRCRVVGTVASECDFDRYENGDGAAPNQSRWWFGGFALVLADVERLASPIPFKGALGFFEVPDGLLSGAVWERCVP